jgi:hypothetical protein
MTWTLIYGAAAVPDWVTFIFAAAGIAGAVTLWRAR